MHTTSRTAVVLAAGSFAGTVFASILLVWPATASASASVDAVVSAGADRSGVAAVSSQDVPEPSTLRGTYRVNGGNDDGARFRGDLVFDRVTHIERDSALGSFAIRPAGLRRLLATSDISYYLRFRGRDGRIVLQAEARKFGADDLEFSVGVYGQGSEGPGLFGGPLVAKLDGTFTVAYVSYGVSGHLKATRVSF